MFVRTYFTEVQDPETVHSAPKDPVCNFFMQIVAKCSKTLPNIVSGLLETFGCVHANIFCGSSVPKTVHSAPKDPICSFFHTDRSEMLQDTPKHRFRSVGDNWFCSSEHILRKFGTPKQCIRLRYTHFATFSMQTVAKFSKTLSNIV